MKASCVDPLEAAITDKKTVNFRACGDCKVPIFVDKQLRWNSVSDYGQRMQWVALGRTMI